MEKKIKAFKEQLSAEEWDAPKQKDIEIPEIKVGDVFVGEYIGTEVRNDPAGNEFVIHILKQEDGSLFSIGAQTVLNKLLADKKGKIVALKFFGQQISKASRPYNLWDCRTLEDKTQKKLA